MGSLLLSDRLDWGYYLGEGEGEGGGDIGARRARITACIVDLRAHPLTMYCAGSSSAVAIAVREAQDTSGKP